MWSRSDRWTLPPQLGISKFHLLYKRGAKGFHGFKVFNYEQVNALNHYMDERRWAEKSLYFPKV